MTFLEQPLDDLLADNITAFERLILQGTDALNAHDGGMIGQRPTAGVRTDGHALSEFSRKIAGPATIDIGAVLAPVTS